VDGAASVASTRPQPVVIRPPKRWVGFGLRELWRFRELLVFLAWRDLKVRYKQTILGVAWAILQPLLYTLVATLLFKRLLGVYSVGPSKLFALAGFVFWLPFANAVTLASNSLVGNASLMTKVYFPRLLAPLGTITASGVDLALSTSLLLVFMAIYGYFPDPQRVWVAIPAVFVAAATAIGVGSWLAALNVKYRDIRFVVPFVLQLWLFGSSVFITFNGLNLSEPWRTLYWLNPMAGAVEAFRWAMLGGIRPAAGDLLLSGCVSIVLLVAGVFFFRRKEREFADIV
jgi:homopolymeric O-antigen transport system permease protein